MSCFSPVPPCFQTAAHVVRNWHFLMQRSVSLALQSTKQDIAITRTVGQFLFEGYDDPLITIASKVPGLSSINIPSFDKFGWFYMVTVCETNSKGPKPRII